MNRKTKGIVLNKILYAEKFFINPNPINVPKPNTAKGKQI